MYPHALNIPFIKYFNDNDNSSRHEPDIDKNVFIPWRFTLSEILIIKKQTWKGRFKTTM